MPDIEIVNSLFQPVQNPHEDRITAILQKRAQPQSYNPTQIGLAGEAAMYSALAGKNQGVEQILDAVIRKPQNEQDDRELQSAQGLYDLFENKRAAGDKQAEALAKRIEMFTGGDPEGTALFLQELHADPENIDPSNAFQVMTKLAGIAKRTGYTSPDSQLQKLKIAQAKRDLAKPYGGGDLPASVQTFQYYQSLPDDQKREFMKTMGREKDPLQFARTQAEFYDSKDKVNSMDIAVGSLNDALALNESARGGALADTRQLGGRVMGTIFGPSDTTVDTTEFENVIKTQVVENLKAAFGGNPTEGERTYLEEVQAGIDKTPAERERLIKRGQKLLEDKKKRELRFQQSVLNGDVFEEIMPTQNTPGTREVDFNSLPD